MLISFRSMKRLAMAGSLPSMESESPVGMIDAQLKETQSLNGDLLER